MQREAAHSVCFISKSQGSREHQWCETPLVLPSIYELYYTTINHLEGEKHWHKVYISFGLCWIKPKITGWHFVKFGMKGFNSYGAFPLLLDLTQSRSFSMTIEYHVSVGGVVIGTRPKLQRRHLLCNTNMKQLWRPPDKNACTSSLLHGLISVQPSDRVRCC